MQGRKRGGGIRFGEMERDALLAHGTAFLLQDRLMNCSDYSTAWICRTCGSLVSLGYEEVNLGTQVSSDNIDGAGHLGPNGEYCRVCRAEAEIEVNEQGREKAARLDATEFSLARHAKVLERRGQMEVIAIPYVFRYLCAELAAMGIRLSVFVP